MVSSLTATLLAATVAALPLSVAAATYNQDSHANFVAYWGQNSYGAANAADTANWQKNISDYCNDDSIDVFPVSFLLKYFSTGNLPEIELANACSADRGDTTFSGSSLLDCSWMADQIKTCQSKGKMVTISMGGATGSNDLSDEQTAKDFADQVWNLFLGGSSKTRPFGDAVLDGVDLDIESGGPQQYAAFITQLRSHFDGASKKYITTAAPQCVFPDSNLGDVLSSAYFDSVYVQFYNNPCGLNKADDPVNWNFGWWAWWAANKSPNKDVKVYIGAPASSTAAGSGYLAADALGAVATDMRSKYASFGGVMVWDASQAVANDNFNVALKKTMTAAGATGFTAPACNATAYASGTTYNAGQEVSYNGFIWRAKWSTGDAPDATVNDNGNWVPVSQCGSGSSSGSTGSTTADSTSTETSATATESSSTESSATMTTESSATTTATESQSTESSSTTAAPTTTPPPAGGIEGGSVSSEVPTSTEDPCSTEESSSTESASTATPTETATETTTDPCEETTSTASSSSSASSSTTTGSTGSSSCIGAAAWSATTVYTGGQYASAGGKTYKAQWWTQGENPASSTSGAWVAATCGENKRAVPTGPRATPFVRVNPHGAKRRL